MLPNLKALRASRGISQQKLADVLGMSQQAINRYENQAVEPDISTLIKLADFFETTIDYIVDRRPNITPKRTYPYELNEKEAKIVDAYRITSSKQQKVVEELMEAFKNG